MNKHPINTTKRILFGVIFWLWVSTDLAQGLAQLFDIFNEIKFLLCDTGLSMFRCNISDTATTIYPIQNLCIMKETTYLHILLFLSHMTIS